MRAQGPDGGKAAEARRRGPHPVLESYCDQFPGIMQEPCKSYPSGESPCLGAPLSVLRSYFEVPWKGPANGPPVKASDMAYR